MAKREPERNAEEHEKLLDLHKIGAIMQKNFIVLIRDKTRIIPLLLFPIFMILVFGFTSGNTPKHISTAVVVLDSSPLSQQLQQEIANNQVFSVTHVVSTEGEGKVLLDNGAVRAVIIIPPGFEDSVYRGDQAAVTIMVDESDSAVAGTSRQALSSIVTTMSNSLSQQRVIALQQSVDAASQQLQAYSDRQTNAYGAIAEKTAAAQETLQQANGLTQVSIQRLTLTLSPPTIIVPKIAGDHANITNSNVIVTDSPADAGTKAQIALMQQSSKMLAGASTNVQQATAIATQANKQALSQQDFASREKNIAQPMRAIQVFTRSKTSSLLRPLTYEEKPAYGTGKRPVDFLVPTIIALTIFQGAVMGMGRSVAGEKREGSLTRVFLTPTSNATIILGTLLFYVVFELFRASFLIAFSMIAFNIKIEGSFLLIGLVLIIFTGISTSIGMIISSMVKSEGQYMAMAMLVSMPTMFLAGVFFPLQAMPKALQLLAGFLPVTYAGEALRDVMIKGFGIQYIIAPFLFLLLFLAVMLGLVFFTFKRDIE